jgi:hypothetical protein
LRYPYVAPAFTRTVTRSNSQEYFYFLNRALVDDESLHFHELIHIVQWHVLGAERFLLAYALGHVSVGVYRNNPFERIAYDLQARFVDLPNPFQVEPLVLRHLRETVPS